MDPPLCVPTTQGDTLDPECCRNVEYHSSGGEGTGGREGNEPVYH